MPSVSSCCICLRKEAGIQWDSARDMVWVYGREWGWYTWPYGHTWRSEVDIGVSFSVTSLPYFFWDSVSWFTKKQENVTHFSDKGQSLYISNNAKIRKILELSEKNITVTLLLVFSQLEWLTPDKKPWREGGLVLDRKQSFRLEPWMV